MELSEIEQRCLGLSSQGLKDYKVQYASFREHAAGDYTLQAEPEAWEALQALCEDAQREGLVIAPCSAFRSFARQAKIVSAKYQGLRPILDENEQPLDPMPPEGVARLRAILHFSALPGCSRHHWGADFDIFAPNLLPEGQNLQLTAHEYEQGSYFYELGCYLNERLAQFGFTRPYMPPYKPQYRPQFATLARNSTAEVEQEMGTGIGKDKDVPLQPVFNWQMGVEPWHISYQASARPWEQAYSADVALSYLEDSDLPFAAHVRELWSQDLVQALLALRKDSGDSGLMSLKTGERLS